MGEVTLPRPFSTVADLVPAPYNPRKIGDADLANLHASMREFGDLSGVVKNVRTGHLVGGHQRVKNFDPAWKIERSPVKDGVGTVALGHVVTPWGPWTYREVDWDEKKEKLANISANKIRAEFALPELKDLLVELDAGDIDLSITGFDEGELKALVDYDRDGKEDDVPPVPKKAVTKPGDLWILGDHRLLCGDATKPGDVEKLMAGDIASFCFTSPPYADQRTYVGGHNLSVGHLAQFLPVAKDFCDLFAVNLGLSRKNGEINSYWDIYIQAARSAGMRFLSWNVWNKGECGSVGLQSAMFGICHEFIFVFGAGPKILNKTLKTKHAFSNAGGSVREVDGSIKKIRPQIIGLSKKLETVFLIPPVKDNTLRKLHPASFPVGLASEYIISCTNKMDVVYEPFGGSGSTMIACEQNNRRCRMLEIEPIFCDVIRARWELFTGKKAVLA